MVVLFVKELRTPGVLSPSNQKGISTFLYLRNDCLLGFLLFSRLYGWFCCPKVLWYMGTAIHKLINNNACLTANTTALILSSVCFVQCAKHPSSIITDVVWIKLQKLRGRWFSEVMENLSTIVHLIPAFQNKCHLNSYQKGKKKKRRRKQKEMLAVLSFATVSVLKQTKYICFPCSSHIKPLAFSSFNKIRGGQAHSYLSNATVNSKS